MENIDLFKLSKNYELYIESLHKYSYSNKEFVSEIKEGFKEYIEKLALSDNKYYEEFSNAISLFYEGVVPLIKIISFAVLNKFAKAFDVFFVNKFKIEPITYNVLFDFLSSLSNSNMLYIIDKMGLSLNVYNGVYEALQNQSKEKFSESLSCETKDLQDVFRQLNALYLSYQMLSLVLKEENAFDVNVDCIVEIMAKLSNVEFADGFFNVAGVYKFCDNENQLLITSEGDINSLSYVKAYIENLVGVSKMLFYFIISMLGSLSLDRNETRIINSFIDNMVDTYRDFGLKEILLYSSEHSKNEANSDMKFVIPEDFFYSTLYSCNDDESYFYNVYDRERRGYSSIVQDFINDLALNGYIADVYNTKAVLLYRLSGRKLPEVNVVKIEWLKEVNAMLHLIKYFYKVLGSGRERLEKGIYNKIEKFISCKDFEIMTSYDRLKNPSNLAENIRATSYSSIFQIFENRIKQSKLKL